MTIRTIDRKYLEIALVPTIIVGVTAVAVVAILSFAGLLDASLAFIYLSTQDVYLLAIGIVILAGAVLVRPRLWRVPDIDSASIWLIGGATAVIALLGRQFVLLDYDMSRDEQMSTFDAAIFASGKLVAALHEPWLSHSQVLNTDFMLPVSERTAWISGYLPMNAAAMGLFDTLGAGLLLGPLTLLLGAVALAACVKTIWPRRKSYVAVALVLYLGSGQVLVNAMTTYAMPLHLTANLCWLWLFLKRRTSADCAALCIGFIAVGLHQPIFHPMFAAPILATLLFQREWRRASLYFFGYAAIGAFWYYWPQFSVSLTGTPLPGNQGSFLTRLTEELIRGRPTGLLEFIANLLRFVAWQHLLLLPLLLLGLHAARRDALMASLAGGMILTLAVMVIILPYQGHGFGYRYLHGLIGSAIILAIYGWDKIETARDAWGGLLLRTTLAGLLIIAPGQLYFAHAFYAPYSRASDAIETKESDFVVISRAAAPFSVDLVINRPFLDKRPIRLIRELIDPALLKKLCGNGARITFLDASSYDEIRAHYGMRTLRDDELDNEKLIIIAKRSGCDVG